MLKAYRKNDGTEVRRGDTITNFRGEEATFWAATRAPDGHRTGKILVGGPNGHEAYMTAFGLIVHDDSAGPYVHQPKHHHTRALDGHHVPRDGLTCPGDACYQEAVYGKPAAPDLTTPANVVAQIRTLLGIMAHDADQSVAYPEDIRELADLVRVHLTVQVRVKNVHGNDLIYPANLTAITFAEIAGIKTLTAATVRGIRALGYTIDVLSGDLPAGW